MDDAAYLGVDWCGGAWFCVAFDESGFDHAATVDEIGALWHEYEDVAERVLVDVPIGLVESGEAGRRCDDLARSVLGPRSASVFTPPVREATRRHSYKAAKRVNERKTGRSLSKQAYHISAGIAAVDELLQNVPAARRTICESHPEVCFRAFAGEPLAHPKTTAGGYAERMEALATFDPAAPGVVKRAADDAGASPATVAVDDVLDAVALAYAARPGAGELRSLPPEPPTDEQGLPMRICYRGAAALE